MGYRVYDKKKHKFIKDNIFLTPDGELVESKKSLFGNKMSFVDSDRFVYQRSTELQDKNDNEVFVGDYLEAQVDEDRVINGLVTFADELGSFIILCFDTGEYFVLSQSVCGLIKIIGNIFDDDKKTKHGKKNKQSLQEWQESC